MQNTILNSSFFFLSVEAKYAANLFQLDNSNKVIYQFFLPALQTLSQLFFLRGTGLKKDLKVFANNLMVRLKRKKLVTTKTALTEKFNSKEKCSD